MERNRMFTLYLMGEKGLSVLDALLSDGYGDYIGAVVTSGDQNVENDFLNEIEQRAKESSIPLFRKKKPNNEQFRTDYALTVAWRWIVQESDYEKVVVFHDSLLPKYRGFTPLVSQLINGERYIGVTAILAAKRYDEGPILEQRRVGIDYPLKIQSAIRTILPLYQELAKSLFFQAMQRGQLTATSQIDEEATYSIWRDDKDLHLDWSQRSDYIQRFVDATGFPYSGAYAYIDEKKVIIDEVEQFKDVRIEFRHEGKVIFFDEGNPVVICGSGLLKIKHARWYENGQVITDWPRFRMRFE